MATYSTYIPTQLFTRAMFNFDASGVADYRINGTIRVSVSDAFASGQYGVGINNEVPWLQSNLNNIQATLGVFSQFANLSFATVVDYDTTPTSSIADPSSVSPFDLSDINITFFSPADPDLLGVSSLATDRFGYAGSRGDIFINPNSTIYGGDLSFAEFSRIRQVLLHELGHSLGLSHPFTQSFGSTQVTQDFAALLSAGFQQLGFKLTNGDDLNKEYFTIMSYDDEHADPSLNAYTPMILDVIALQQVYGEGSGTHGSGNDLIEAGNIGYRTYFDKGGIDTVEAGFYDQGAYINLGVSITGADHLVGIVMSLEDAETTILDGGKPDSLRWLYGEYENANGSVGTDFLVGNSLANQLIARGGDDYLFAEDGADSLAGDDGNDNAFGGPGADTIHGGNGNDHLYGQSASGGSDAADVLNGGDGSDYLQGNAGNDSLDGGAGSDRIQGGRDDDRIVGGDGNDTINGNLGNDNINAGTGNDFARGGQGNDTIFGGDGNDQLQGDLGVDQLSGGRGADIFSFGGNSALFAAAAADVITDFEDGVDMLKLGYTPQAILKGLAGSFSAAPTSAQSLFDGRVGDGEVAAIKVGSDTFLFYSSNGGASADSAVRIVGIDNALIAMADFA